MKQSDGVFRIVYDKAVRLAKGSNLDHQEARIQFHSRMEQLKVNRALINAGIRSGDSVLVADWDFDWE